ncbi:hypothetical protein [Haloterrigena salinisoli]|uniref:hypothetical protein n=1 Tax=Haloterrigena salinisoli TaxID=3132747 RepID=UPI0030D47C96
MRFQTTRKCPFAASRAGSFSLFAVIVPTTGEDETLAVDDLEVYIDGMSVPLSSLGVDDDRDVQDEGDDGGTLDKLVGQLD